MERVICVKSRDENFEVGEVYDLEGEYLDDKQNGSHLAFVGRNIVAAKNSEFEWF